MTTNKLNDPARAPLGEQPQPPLTRMQTDLQFDPELTEGPASGKRIAVFAGVFVVLICAVFYGLHSSPTTAGTSSVKTEDRTAINQPGMPAPIPLAQTADSKTPPAAGAQPPAPNATAGTTTGTAPAKPQQPQSAPTGTEVDRSKTGPK